MRILIRGKEYQAKNFQGGNVLHLIELQQQTRALFPGGLGMRTLQLMSRELSAFAREAKAWEESGKVGEEPLMPDAAPAMFAVNVFLSMRGAGEPVSFAEAACVSMDEVEQIPEPGDRIPGSDGDESDPTVPGHAGPATPEGDAPAAPVKKKKSRSSGSKSPSVNGSR